jgi:predicted MFS family arabinose efflux permease
VTTTPAPRRDISFARLITTSISARLLVDIGAQMFNPFLPIFAAGLNTNVVVMGRLLGLRSSMGMLAPIFGALADRVGYRQVMTGALLAAALGMVVFGSSRGVAQALIGMILLGIGSAGFVPTLQAYLSARLPYAQLARGMGMLEYSWALTGIVGLSLMGLLIAATGWRTPFFLLGAGMLVMVVVLRTLPSARNIPPVPSSHPGNLPSATLSQRIANFFHVETNAVSTYAIIFATAANFYGAIQFMILHGVWFADQYGFGARELGYVALLFGCFDLVASVSVSLFTDRFGKRRSVIVGTTGAMLGYLLIPFLNVGVIPAVLSAALARGFFEFAIVANLPLLSEQSPNQRGKIMTLSSAVTLGVSTICSFVAPALYTRIGIAGIATISALSSAIALLLLITRVRDHDAPR